MTCFIQLQERTWQMERRVPLTVVLAIIVQIGAGLIWAAQLDVRVARIEKDVDRIGEQIESLVMSRGS